MKKNNLEKGFFNTDKYRFFIKNNLYSSVSSNLCQSVFKKAFSELTDFECKVLKATLKIPLGETRTYQWVAKKIGSPKAVRAVGNALKKNPFPLIIPCHRVVNADGKIGGYSGGKKIKNYLLKLEKKITSKFHL